MEKQETTYGQLYKTLPGSQNFFLISVIHMPVLRKICSSWLCFINNFPDVMMISLEDFHFHINYLPYNIAISPQSRIMEFF